MNYGVISVNLKILKDKIVVGLGKKKLNQYSTLNRFRLQLSLVHYNQVSTLKHRISLNRNYRSFQQQEIPKYTRNNYLIENCQGDIKF